MNTNKLIVAFKLFSLGFMPISCLCMALFDWVPLHVSTPLIVLPSCLLFVRICEDNPSIGIKAYRGFFSGMIACGVYDLTRLSFVYFGVWDDFVLRIGDLMIQTPHSSAWYGYSWRIIGNGGGMGAGFAMLQVLLDELKIKKVSGIVFGVGIWGALLATLALSPLGQKMLFPLNTLTFIASLIGHLEYGSILEKASVTLPGLQRQKIKFLFLSRQLRS